MIVKAILFITGLIAIGILFLLQNAFSKPIYNKMSNMWQEDSEGRQFAHAMIIAMVFIAFLLGILVS